MPGRPDAVTAPAPAPTRLARRLGTVDAVVVGLGAMIGAGVFGGYHAAQYARLPGVTLSAVFDTHPERAAAVAMPSDISE